MGFDEEIPRVIDHYRLLEMIGQGTFSIVYRALDTITNIHVAVKIFEKKVNSAMFQKEVSICKLLDHPLIAQIYDTCEDDNYFYMVMEYITGEPFLNCINRCNQMEENDIRYYSIQIISILDYLHNQAQVLHRDLKAENIMVTDKKILKLIDFGFSKQFSDENPQTSTMCGSLVYSAPEVLTGRPYSTPADIWSFGVLLYAMAECCFPFQARSQFELIFTITRNFSLVFKSMISQELKDLITLMLERDQSKRIKVQQMKSHLFFVKSNIISKLNYLKNPSMKVFPESIENGIVESMGHLNINTDGLVDDLLAHKFSNKTTAYRILRRNKINSMIEMEYANLSNKPRYLISPSSSNQCKGTYNHDNSFSSAISEIRRASKPGEKSPEKPTYSLNLAMVRRMASPSNMSSRRKYIITDSARKSKNSEHNDPNNYKMMFAKTWNRHRKASIPRLSFPLILSNDE
ncbi:CAMK family protein kinase [Tritrichomonas foetus]|uniref:CAMK family protein kinase n=1 Tax=Tritrichomonas foetus TaxID=1144522 RepID=A0A1J4KR90_9EUKA|nr:CAMK family protein kinase [Tritrichomonas foetus]|eukprot:OHT13763.1 CAMK family protein kinase [Tritrichomonas foetus]